MRLDTPARHLGLGVISRPGRTAISRPAALAELIRSAASLEQTSTAAVQASRTAVKATRSAADHPAEHTVAAAIRVSE